MNPHYRLAVLSDIHGNLPAFDAVMHDLEQAGPLDGVLVAGDIVTGPGQVEVLQRLVDLGAVMVQGNSEHLIAQLADGTAPDYCFTTKQFSLARWAHDHLSASQRDFLRALPEQRVYQLPGADPIRIVHGSPRRVDELILPNLECHPQLDYKPVLLEEVWPGVVEPVIVFGHTHLPWQVQVDGRLALNPGAVAFPEDFYPGAEYALLAWDGSQWTAAFRKVAYELRANRNDFEASGFLACSPLARVYLQSLLTGRDAIPPYFRHLRSTAEQMGRAGERYYVDEVWDRAAETFAWEV